MDIAADYMKVKNYVFRRYSGINSITKLNPGYTVQNEMTKCTLQEELGLPVVYYYPAVFDALTDIKACWMRLRTEQIETLDKMKARQRTLETLKDAYIKQGDKQKVDNIEKNNLGSQKYDS